MIAGTPQEFYNWAKEKYLMTYFQRNGNGYFRMI